jgi:hypothetical protein
VAVFDQRAKIAAMRGGGGHPSQQSDPDIRIPARDEVIVPNPAFAGPHRHGVYFKSTPLGHARQQKMQAWEAIRGDEQLAASQESFWKRADDRVQRGGDITGRRQRAWRCADEISPSRDEFLPDLERPLPLSIIRRSPECCDARERLSNALVFPRKHADGVVQEISRSIAGDRRHLHSMSRFGRLPL